MTASFVIEGEDELMAKLKAMWPKFSNAAVKGCMDWADDVMNEAKRITPVDTGALRASGYTQTMSGPEGVEIGIGFSANYALYVHENLEAHHDVGQAKFLETPMLLKSDELPKRMVKMMERAAEEA